VSEDLTIIPYEHYLHFIITGSANYNNAVILWKTIAATCREHNCFNVLGEQKITNAMPTMDAWRHQNIFIDAGITAKYRIAWVDANPVTYKQTEFIRTVLSNRDIGYGKLFTELEKAKSWLLEKIPKNGA